LRDPRPAASWTRRDSYRLATESFHERPGGERGQVPVGDVVWPVVSISHSCELGSDCAADVALSRVLGGFEEPRTHRLRPLRKFRPEFFLASVEVGEARDGTPVVQESAIPAQVRHVALAARIPQRVPIKA
jgi:hypothetical protein